MTTTCIDAPTCRGLLRVALYILPSQPYSWLHRAMYTQTKFEAAVQSRLEMCDRRNSDVGTGSYKRVVDLPADQGPFGL